MCLPPVSDFEIVPDAVAHSRSNNNQKMTQGTHDINSGPHVSFYGRRLVFFGAAETQPEPALQKLFSQYGEVVDMFIVRSALGISSGCGYVTFASAQQATAAVQGLQGTNECADPGTTLGVLLVTDTGDSNGAGEASRVDSACAQQDSKVFFTKVPPTVTSQQLIQLFTACGDVAHLELFIPWPGAKISRGCGLVEFTSSAAAAAAVHSLHQQFTWPHSHSALVVEWVDRNRQGNNKAKQARAANGACAAGSPTNPPCMASLADQQAYAGAWRPAHGMGPNRSFAAAKSMPQQQLQQLRQQAGGLARSSHSCPLPQLPPGWQVIGTAQQLPSAARMARPAAAGGAQWSQLPAPLNNAMHMQLSQQQAYMQQNGAAAAVDASNGSWMACPVASSTLSTTSMDLSSLTSLGSVYDPSGLSSSMYSSTNNSGVLQSQFVSQGSQQVLDLSGQDLSACPAGTNVSAVLASPAAYSEPMMSSSGAMSGNSADAVWQQLLQQNVMLLQTMTPPPEEEQLLVPSAAASQAPGLQASSIVASSGGFTGAMPAYMPLSQAQQVQAGPVLYAGNSALQPQQQPVWYMQNTQVQVPSPAQQQQQAQQAAPDSSVVVALPLTQRQLAAMAGVLPEVPRWTGAQAWISSAASGGLQLCMSGTYNQLQAGHTAVAMLLGKAGVNEALAPALVHAAAN